jgi:hypothetical protein
MPSSVFPYTQIVSLYLLLRIQLEKQDRSLGLSSLRGFGTAPTFLDWPWLRIWWQIIIHRPLYYYMWMIFFFVGHPNPLSPEPLSLKAIRYPGRRLNYARLRLPA